MPAEGRASVAHAAAHSSAASSAVASSCPRPQMAGFLLPCLVLLLALAPPPAAGPLAVLVSDGWPSAAAVTLMDPAARSTSTAVANVLQTDDLTLAAVARLRFNASVLFGGLPDNHAGPAVGVFDRSHPKASGLNGLYPRWRANLRAFIAPALPLLRNGTLQGIFLGDEVYCSNLPFSNYSAVLTELRRLVGPAAIIWANECGHPSGWPVAMWPKAPPELDWLSIDQYDVLHGAEEVTMAQRFWSLDAVKTKLWPHQRLLAVPGTFACDQGQYQSIAEAQSQVLTKLRGYAAWAKTDSRLIGLWPWHWTNRTKSQNGGPCDMELGCEAMPGCVSELRALGRSVPRNDSSLLLSSGRGNGS